MGSRIHRKQPWHDVRDRMPKKGIPRYLHLNRRGLKGGLSKKPFPTARIIPLAMLCSFGINKRAASYRFSYGAFVVLHHLISLTRLNAQKGAIQIYTSMPSLTHSIYHQDQTAHAPRTPSPPLTDKSQDRHYVSFPPFFERVQRLCSIQPPYRDDQHVRDRNPHGTGR
jgi:hypothetical protein